MIRGWTIWIGYCHFLLCPKVLDAQAQGGFTDVWLFAGVHYEYSSKLQLVVQPVYLFLPGRAAGVADHSLLNGIIFNFRTHNVLIDHRSMIWNRLRKGEDDQHYIRNRIRITLVNSIRSFPVKLYAFDELSYSINNGSFTRNRLAVGCAYGFRSSFNIDVAFARQKDFRRQEVHLFFVMATVQLSRKNAATK